MEIYEEKNKCSGCTACYSVCPQKCISMLEDSEGFLYPYIDEARCIKCHRCKQVCPIITPPQMYGCINTYAVQNKDRHIRINSTSGGFFSIIAEKYIKRGNYICAAGYNSKGVVSHIITNNISDLINLRGSKYVQSDINDCFKEIKRLLSISNRVLFVGTPCQAAGLRKVVGENENLVIVDIACYGVPSPLVFDLWKKEIEKINNKSIHRIEFRDKTYGYSSPNVKVIFNDGSFIEQTHLVKMYMKLFMDNLTIRESCYNCKFKGVDRASDLTLGDCWSIRKFSEEMDDNIGTTNVFIHTNHGLNLFESVKEEFKSIKVDTESAVQYDGKKIIECAKPNNNRENFFVEISLNGFSYAANIYSPFTIKEKMVTNIKRVFKGNIILNMMLKKIRVR